MRISELINFVNSRVPFTYQAHRFHVNSPARCAYIAIQPGQAADEWLGTRRPSFQIVVRGDVNEYEFAETKANEIFEALLNVRHVNIGSDHIVQIFSNGSAPFYIGNDENDRPHFSMNFRVTIQP